MINIVDKYASLAGKPEDVKKKKKHMPILKMKPGIAEHDYQRFISRAQSFLCDDGVQVKFIVELKGRHRSNPQIGLDLLGRVVEDLNGCSALGNTPGPSSLFIVLNPVKHK